MQEGFLRNAHFLPNVHANTVQTLEMYKAKKTLAGVIGKRGLFDIFAFAQKTPPEQKISWNDGLNPRQEANDKKTLGQNANELRTPLSNAERSNPAIFNKT